MLDLHSVDTSFCILKNDVENSNKNIKLKKDKNIEFLGPGVFCFVEVF